MICDEIRQRDVSTFGHNKRDERCFGTLRISSLYFTLVCALSPLPHMSQPLRPLPTELVEEIIDVVSDHSTLRSCSFVAKSWRPRALAHIFRSVVLRGSTSCFFYDARPRNVYRLTSFTRLLDEDLHLAVYMREIAIRADSMTSDDFEYLLHTLVDRQSSLPLDWDVQRLVLTGAIMLDGRALALAGDALSAAWRSLRTFQLDGWFVESHDLIKFTASFPALAELTLNAAAGDTSRVLHRLHGRTPIPVTSTCRMPHLRSLVVSAGRTCMCQLSTILPELRQHAPKLEVVELRVSLPAHSLLFSTLPLHLDGWIKRLDIQLVRLSFVHGRVLKLILYRTAVLCRLLTSASSRSAAQG